MPEFPDVVLATKAIEEGSYGFRVDTVPEFAKPVLAPEETEEGSSG